MNIQEIKEQLTDNKLTQDERKEFIPKLMNMFSPVSKTTVADFSSKWMNETSGKTFEEYTLALNKTLIDCIDMELHAIGTAVRQQFGLSVLSLNTLL